MRINTQMTIDPLVDKGWVVIWIYIGNRQCFPVLRMIMKIVSVRGRALYIRLFLKCYFLGTSCQVGCSFQEGGCTGRAPWQIQSSLSLSDGSIVYPVLNDRLMGPLHFVINLSFRMPNLHRLIISSLISLMPLIKLIPFICQALLLSVYEPQDHCATAQSRR